MNSTFGVIPSFTTNAILIINKAPKIQGKIPLNPIFKIKGENIHGVAQLKWKSNLN